jgi:heme/copper-type cytochrome/quinol oxidase subunit 4
MIFKRIASIGFAISFILAIAVFTDVFSGIISKTNAKYGIIVFGGIALLMNLLSFKYDQHAENNNIIFWVGSVIIFVGLIFKLQHYPFNQLLLIVGIFTVTLSYFFNPTKKPEKNDELLDN